MDNERQLIMLYSIDRIDEQWAVIVSENDGTALTIPVCALPDGAEEGSIISEEGGVYALDRCRTAEKRHSVYDRLRRLSKG